MEQWLLLFYQSGSLLRVAKLRLSFYPAKFVESFSDNDKFLILFMFKTLQSINYKNRGHELGPFRSSSSDF